LTTEAAGPGLVEQRKEKLFLGLAFFCAAVSAVSLSLRAFSFCLASRRATVSASMARIRPQVAAIMPATSVTRMSEAATTAPRCRRTVFRSRYQVEGGQASTGSLFR